MIRISLLALLLASPVASLNVMARDLDQNDALRLRESGAILALEQLLQQALARYPNSKLLEAELEQHDNLYVYEVELLTEQSVVREIKLNAATGDVLDDKVDN